MPNVAKRRRAAAPQPGAKRKAAREWAQRDGVAIRAARDDQAVVRSVCDTRRGNECANAFRHRMDDAVGESADETNDVKKGEALRQQRRHFVGIDGDECACGNGVVAPNGTTRQDGVDRQMLQARTMPAATAIGRGRRAARTSRHASIPPHQRATDSHDYTRLGC